MQQNRWREVKVLFQAALERPVEERDAFLSEACVDPSLRAEVDGLLRSHEQSPGFLRTPLVGEEVAGADPHLGRELDGFEIVRRIGAGGMGVVYEARQRQPERRAAVKVLRPGFATSRLLRRFEYEAEILARLQHPGIAHVYAAGMFDAGEGAQPWFAMELIEGETLRAYVGGRRLRVDEKVTLLLKVCDAVQHAHQRGIIHRDLKPANILVGDAGQPKILDFGVARAIDAEVQQTMHTNVGELVGTLSYMSPEQLAGDPSGIDARCDVYALGVIGYELLSGRLPYDHRNGGVTDLMRAIESDVPRRLGVLDPNLRGDIETIIAKALEKDRERRYQSTADLAADLRRYLNDEPVLARSATALYQLSKFAKRNRAVVGGVVATMLALLVGLVLYAAEARRAGAEAARAQYEADKATAINNFIANDFLMKLLAAANGQGGDGPLPVAELVDQAAANIGVMFEDDPLSGAAVRNEVASIYYNLGAFEAAAEQFEMALAQWESRLGANHPDTLKAVNNLGQSLAAVGRMAEAERLYRRALRGRLRVLGEENPYTLASMNNLAILLQQTGRPEEAERMLRRVLDAQRRVHGDSHKHTLITMVNLGTLLAGRGELGEAERLHRHVHEASLATLGEDHVTTLAASVRLGTTLWRAGNLKEAEGVLAEAVAGLDRAVGPEHRDVLVARRALARVYRDRGHSEAAIAELRRAMNAAADRPSLAAFAESVEAELTRLLERGGPDMPSPGR